MLCIHIIVNNIYNNEIEPGAHTPIISYIPKFFNKSLETLSNLV